MPQSTSLLGIVIALGLFAACTSGSSDDEDEPAAGSGGVPAGGSHSAGSGAGGKGSGASSGGGSDAGGDNAGGSGTGVAGSGAGGEGGSGACCVEETLSWGRVGGNVIYSDSSSLASCAVFSHERVPQGGDPATLSCTQGVAVACGEDGIGADEVLEALSHADVEAAIAEAPVLYGVDPRPYDGQVVQITIGDAMIEVGDECMVASCMAIPEGVQALADLLLALTEQELALNPCATVFE